MRKLFLSMAAVGLIALQASAAHAIPVATTTFNWSYFDLSNPADSTVSGHGTFDATPLSGNQYQVTHIDGTANGYTISGLNYSFPYPIASPDQIFYDGLPPNFTSGGVSFNAGPLSFNFYSSSGGFCGGGFVNCLYWDPSSVVAAAAAEDAPAAQSGPHGNSPIEFTATIAPTPLPATWFMMLGGLAAFGFIAYHRKKLATVRVG